MKLYKKITPKTAKEAFWLGFGFCLLGCFFIIFAVSPLTGLSKHFGKNHDGYIQIARSLSAGHGYVFEQDGPAVFHRPPFYPFLLVPITFLPEFLQRPALILMQSLMVGCITAMIFQIAKRFFSLSTAAIAVIIFLVNPWVYWNAKNPMTTITQGLLYTLFAILIGRQFLAISDRYNTTADKTNLWANSMVTGIVAAALALTHGAMIAVSFILLFVLFLTGAVRRNFRAVKTAIITALVMAALVAPWTYRNWAVFGRFMPVTGGSGLAYFNGNTHWNNITEEPQRKGETHIDASLRALGIEGTEATHTHWKGLKDIDLEEMANEKMADDIRSHPIAFAKKIILNAVEYYFPTLTYSFLAVKRVSLQKLAITIFNLLLWILALMGICRNQKDAESKLGVRLMLVAIVLYAIWFFPFATFIGHSLYTFATIPFLSILAANGITSLRLDDLLKQD